MTNKSSINNNENLVDVLTVCITLCNVTEVLGLKHLLTLSLYGYPNERISTVNPHMRKRIALCKRTQ